MKLRELMPKIDKPKYLDCDIIFYFKLLSRTMAWVKYEGEYKFFKLLDYSSFATSMDYGEGPSINHIVRHYCNILSILDWYKERYTWYEDAKLISEIKKESFIRGI